MVIPRTRTMVMMAMLVVCSALLLCPSTEAEQLARPLEGEGEGIDYVYISTPTEQRKWCLFAVEWACGRTGADPTVYLQKRQKENGPGQATVRDTSLSTGGTSGLVVGSSLYKKLHSE